MKCHICHIKDAQIVFTQIVNNEKIVMQICSDCARDKGLSIEFDALEPSLPDQNVIFKSADSGVDIEKKHETVPDISCKVCGMTYSEFKSGGLFGCDKCLEAFNDQVRDILKQIHGATLHEGQEPKPLSAEAKDKMHLKKLHADLVHCVEIEEYEEAAKIRDEIAELQKGVPE